MSPRILPKARGLQQKGAQDGIEKGCVESCSPSWAWHCARTITEAWSLGSLTWKVDVSVSALEHSAGGSRLMHLHYESTQPILSLDSISQLCQTQGTTADVVPALWAHVRPEGRNQTKHPTSAGLTTAILQRRKGSPRSLNTFGPNHINKGQDWHSNPDFLNLKLYKEGPLWFCRTW